MVHVPCVLVWKEEQLEFEMAGTIWQKAFFKAHLEFMAEKLKKKIEAAWGPTSDKAADAMIERMGSQWSAMIQQAKAEQTFREKLTKLYSEAEKKQ